MATLITVSGKSSFSVRLLLTSSQWAALLRSSSQLAQLITSKLFILLKLLRFWFNHSFFLNYALQPCFVDLPPAKFLVLCRAKLEEGACLWCDVVDEVICVGELLVPSVRVAFLAWWEEVYRWQPRLWLLDSQVPRYFGVMWWRVHIMDTFGEAIQICIIRVELDQVPHHASILGLIS